MMLKKRNLILPMLFPILSLGLVIGCGQNSGSKTESQNSAQSQSSSQSEGQSEQVTNPDNPVVVMETSMGNLTIEVYQDKAPVTADNFLKYVKDGFYDGTIFHRVIPGFVIQGGGFTADMQKKPTNPPIKNERGTLSMARTQAVNSATSQFFINLTDNSSLDHNPQNFGYAVFAKVVDGMGVVDQIAQVPTTNKGPYQNVPSKPVVIEKAYVK
jgi:peptidyl-prolyl cis-trans isomerase A (cyclophilin A)